MKLVKIDYHNINWAEIDKAAQILREGGLVIFPTETVYGLGADAYNNEAISRVYKIKKRPQHKPLSLHISDLDSLFNYIDKIPKGIKNIINEFWPGPVTIIIDTKKGKIGFRMPDNKIALELIKRSKVEVVAPSANISGQSPPKHINEISQEIKNEVDILIDGGRTKIGIESTVLDMTSSPYKILREGAIDKKALDTVIST